MQCNQVQNSRNSDPISTDSGRNIADAMDWQQRDEYYWAGPGRWTICRVFAQNRLQYEVWAANGTRHGMEPSLAAAILLCDKVKG